MAFEYLDGAWRLSYYARPQDFPTPAAALPWLRGLRAAGFRVLYEGRAEITSPDDLPPDPDHPGGRWLEDCLCVKRFPSLDAGKRWLLDHADFVLRSSDVA